MTVAVQSVTFKGLPTTLKTKTKFELGKLVIISEINAVVEDVLFAYFRG